MKQGQDQNPAKTSDLDSRVLLKMLFSGRVQGVGFRATVFRIAGGLPITGTVCNLSDGRVELLAEGSRGELSEFRQSVLRELDRFIVDFTENWEPPRGYWARFAIGPDKYCN